MSFSISVGILELLTLLFIGLKLSSFITWSWWAVFAPIWLPISLVLLAGVVVLIMAVLVAGLERLFK